MNISVIIPVKNRAALLRVTLDCIFAQTKKPHEIIVVDDGSTDEFDEVVRDYANRVIFTQSAGKGPGAARNTGMRLASGNAIQFFDSDDLMTVNKLEVQSKLLEEHDADFVYGPWVKASYDNNTWKQVDVIMQYHSFGSEKFADLVLQGWCNITQSVLFRKELLDKVGFWREDIMTHEDYEYWFRIAQHSSSIVHENQTCVIYRQHKNQITDRDIPNQSRWMDGIQAMQMIKENIRYRPSFKSSLLFKGRRSLAEKGYISNFGNDSQLKSALLYKFYVFYFKLNKKLTKVKGSGWQKMHGISLSRNVFADYIKLLCK